MPRRSWLTFRSRRRTRRKSGRRILPERLEDRRLLASDWHNAALAADVNADQQVSPLDALLIINKINADGGGPLPDLAPGQQPAAYYDTTGDGFLFPVDALLVVNTIESGSGTTADQLRVDIVPVDTTTILAAFSRPMDASAIDPENYQIVGDDGEPVEVIEAFFAEGESVVQLQTTPQSSAGFTINVHDVSDRNGQVVLFEGRVFNAGNPKGAVVSAAATSSTRVVVVFNEAMADNALAPQNYSIKDPAGNSLRVTDVQFNGPLGMVFVLITEPQSNVQYTLTASNVTDLQGDGLQTNTRSFLGIEDLPKLLSATPVGRDSVLLTFDHAMSDDALSPSAYAIKDSTGETLPVLSATFVGTERRLVRLVTGPQSADTYTIQSITATDLDGNALTPPGPAGIFQGAPAPSLIAAIPTDATHVFLTFAVPVGDSALAPSSYKLEQLDDQGNVIGTLPISAAEFVGGERTVVSLTTPERSDTLYRISTTDGLYDAAGSPLAVRSLEFPGLGANQAELIGAVSTNPTTMLLMFNVSMSDDVLSPSSYVIKDSLGVPLPVIGAQFVGTERRVVQLTTQPQSVGPYTIHSITATDARGNPVSSIDSIGSIPGTAAPTLSHATATDTTHVYLTFAGPVGDSALSPSSYRIEKLDDQGNVIGNLTINSAVFVGDQRTVVALTTTGQTNDTYRLSTTEILTDVTGSPVPTGQIEFQGVGSQAQLVAAHSTSPTSLILTFNVPMSDDALSPSLYFIQDESGARLPILKAEFIGTEHRLVQLTTGPQTSQNYTVVSINTTAVGGSQTVVPASAAINTFPGPVMSGGSSVPVDGPPRVVGAASLSNTSVLVAFSEPMADNALNPAHYFIVQQNINPEVGYVPVLSAVFYSNDHRSVLLTTGSQNELTYAVTAVNVTDQAGDGLAPAVIAGQQRIDPSTALFPGTPASGLPVDTDEDGLPDSVEVRGWTVTVTLLNGNTVTREVTSDPNNPDTDGDDLWDAQELNIGTDPRLRDTDGDQLSDWAEFNEIYSDPWNQDSDGDGLDDFLEFEFFKTSPYFADTDGDQIEDGDEILGNRNARVSDLPRPEITVGEVNLELDVRFTETNDQERRDLETKSVASTLSRSNSQTFTRSDTINAEAHLDLGTKDGTDGGTDKGLDARNIYVRGGFSVGYSFQQTAESATETQQAYERSLSTDREVTRGFTVERAVEGAAMRVAIDLRNLSTLAYRVKNLQVTAFMQDPQDHGRLTPIATLLPDSEPEEGFTLGPLVSEKGPFSFSNFDVPPNLVENLMANSSGLIFRISNFDIVDENDRNFAFTSQEIVERTARLVIDYGGASSLRNLLSGESFNELDPGDETELFRVATSAGQVIDTNFSGDIDGDDRRAPFDAVGKEVGITLFEALDAVGLKRYEARLVETTGNETTQKYEEFEPEGTEPVSLSDDQILASYSTYIAPAEVIGGISYPEREKIFRVRGISNDTINDKYWEILTPQGIDQLTDLSELVLKTDSPVSINFVQDLDRDGLTADVEFFLRTSDSPLPFGAEVPGTTDIETDTITFSTDPGFATGTIVRVSEDTARDPVTKEPGLTAGTSYYMRNLGLGSYSFHGSFANATAQPESTNQRIPLPGTVTTGVYSAARPFSTDRTDPSSPTYMSVAYSSRPSDTDTVAESVTFSRDPVFPLGSAVQVTRTGGGLTVGTNYFVRPLGAGAYSFFDSATNAAGTSTAGRVNLADDIKAAIFRGNDRKFPTATLVQVTADTARDPVTNVPSLVAGTNYYIRDLGEGSYSFYDSVEHATAGSDSTTGRVALAGNVTAGIFSPTAKGRDTDGDGLDDRFEALVGWMVNTPQRTYRVYSAPNRGDSNFDTPKPGINSDGDDTEDRLEYDGSDLMAAPAGWIDTNSDGLRNRFEIFQLVPQGEPPLPDYVLDPIRKDTDGDGINDGTEIVGFEIRPITGAKPFTVNTNPTNPFTDSDTFSDGLERLLGLDPTNGADTDEDGDGLPDLVERLGWTVYTFGVSTTAYTQGEYLPGYDRTVTPDSTDLVANVVRFNDDNDPGIQRFALVQVNQSPYFLGRLNEQPEFNRSQFGLYLSATDAAAGTTKGMFDLTAAVAEILIAADFKYVQPTLTNFTAPATDADTVHFDASDDPSVSASTLVRVTGGGLDPDQDYFLGRRATQNDPTMVRYSLYVSESAARAGTPAGAIDLTDPITAIRLPADSRKVSRTDSVDSDEDGLTDYEEFFLGTDPSSVDSDRDGIDDRVEYLGYALGHEVGGKDLGFIRTNPLDADTDNDKRSDGDEAELVDIEQNAWVVRVRGETPYRAYSNPLLADADFDGLVDGDEFAIDPLDLARHTDPNIGDTDGDFRDDGVERGRDLSRPPLTNPLAVDTRVTVVAEYVNIPGAHDFEFALNVRTPDSAEVAGLSATPRTVFASNEHQIGRLEVHTFLGGESIVRFLYINENGDEVLTDPARTVVINPATGLGYDRLFYDWKGIYDPGANGVPLNARFRFVVHNTPTGAGYFVADEEFVYTGNNSIAYYDVGDGGFNSPFIDPPTVLDENLPLAHRSYTFGMASDERFSIEGSVTLFTSAGTFTERLGGLEGVKAEQENDSDEQTTTTKVRPVFAWDQVKDKFIEEFTFKTTLNGVEIEVGFYFIIG